MSDKLYPKNETTEAKVKDVMFFSIASLQFMTERRNTCFQMIGMYDGAMSQDCKAEFRKEYELWDAMIKERMEINQ